VTENLKFLSEAKRTFDHPNTRPADSASIVIVDRRGGVLRVLMGRRHERHVFYPGAYVFPGGRVDPDDGRAPVAADPPPAMLDKLKLHMRGRINDRRARAIVLAGIRETFEEAGILIGKPGPVPKRAPKDWAPFLAHGLLPDPSGLTYFMRAITPPRRPRRFDNRFFAMEASAIALDLPRSERPTDELGELVWLPLEEATTLKLPSVTQVALDELKVRLASPGGLASTLPIPYYHVSRRRFVRELL
jgi:8-oxo-dGTP pyrophosphatase MutT (NUDIX family)